MLMNWMDQHFKNGHLTKSNLQIQRDPYQNSNPVLHGIGKINVQFHMEQQKTQNSEIHPQQQENICGNHYPQPQAMLQGNCVKNCIVLVQKQACGSMEQNRRSRNEPSHIWSPDFFHKGAVNIQWKKDSLFNKWCWSNWHSACRRMKIDPFLSPCTKLKSKWIKDLLIKPDTLKL